ncbi:hypothetical protein E1J38_013400 [Seonamhaeicola sediminis]|uniref:Uncharacterized protein n=1 Tax=Seonamhaeicola sediminis TaxID=2528206 RepID=A0A562YAU7_9FLAO|nr:hypothetical protein [Seonamhaeicola sediminis]TWO31513.1 hypothetical protein E1J38_013400 [Seonamhaeicola sediminis]
MPQHYTRTITITVRTVYENGMGLADQYWYDDKLTLSPNGTMDYADEDWYQGIVHCDDEKTIITLSGKDIPPDWDGKKGHHMEINLYEIGIDDIEINTLHENVKLIDSSFTFTYVASKLN